MKIRIPQPCSEDWGEMTPNEQGRHCASCDKTVTDFTQMSDKQIVAALQNSSSTCGRFSKYQLNRELVLHPTPQKHFGLLKVAACAVLSANLLDGFSQNVPQNFVETHQAENHPNDNDTEIPFNGIIKFKVSGTSDQLDSLIRIEFKINDFQMVFDKIELEQIYEFHVPDSVLWDTLEITLFESEQEERRFEISKEKWLEEYLEIPYNIDLERKFPLLVAPLEPYPFKIDVYTLSWAHVSGNFVFGDFIIKDFESFNPSLIIPESKLKAPILINRPEPEIFKEEDNTKLAFQAHKAGMVQEEGSIWKTLYYFILAGFVGFATNWAYKRRNKLKEGSKSEDA